MSNLETIYSDLYAVIGDAIDEVELLDLAETVAFHRIAAAAQGDDVYTVIGDTAVFSDGSYSPGWVPRDEAA